MPWLGFFDKIRSSDTFVILDTVKCSKNSFFNRNKFSTDKSLKKVFWLSVPLNKESYSGEIKDATSSEKIFLNKHVKYFKNI